MLPYCYFAYRRSVLGLVLTVLALATSMFWFPKPAEPDPGTLAFLAMEKEYLTGEWTAAKIAMGAAVPLWFGLLAWAFWRRSWVVGLVLVNLGSLGKIAWSLYYGQESGWVLVPAALLGLLVCNAAILAVYWRLHRVRPTA